MTESTKSEGESEEFEAFEASVMRNLEKNGFPEKIVSFPIDSLYEAAAAKGFSFNRVRSKLESKGIRVTLEETRVLFEKKEQDSVVPDFQNLAASLLGKLGPEQMSQMKKVVEDMNPLQLSEIKKRLASMTESEKQTLMEQMKNFTG